MAYSHCLEYQKLLLNMSTTYVSLTDMLSSNGSGSSHIAIVHHFYNTVIIAI